MSCTWYRTVLIKWIDKQSQPKYPYTNYYTSVQYFGGDSLFCHSDKIAGYEENRPIHELNFIKLPMTENFKHFLCFAISVLFLVFIVWSLKCIFWETKFLENNFHYKLLATFKNWKIYVLTSRKITKTREKNYLRYLSFRNMKVIFQNFIKEKKISVFLLNLSTHYLLYPLLYKTLN